MWALFNSITYNFHVCPSQNSKSWEENSDFGQAVRVLDSGQQPLEPVNQDPFPSELS